jgi:hypothetical protein
MKKRFFLASVLLFGLAILCWLLAKRPPQSPPQTAERNSASLAEQQPVPNNGIHMPSPVVSTQNGSNTVIIEGVPVSKDYLQYAQHVREDPAYDWKQPINFYGKVVDENNQPVVGASVDYTWSTIQAESGTMTKHDQTDSSGLFSIHETGSGVGITVSKDGYYTPPSQRLKNYEYANHGDGVFTPDANNPVVFRLRKRGAGVDLITSKYGVKNYFGVTVPLDGTPVRVDLLERKSGGQEGQLILSETKPPYDKWKQATEWSFRMEIPDGGFVEENDEFAFEAPESGYQPVMEFDFEQSQTNWTTILKKDFYVRFGNPPRYGCLHLDTRVEMDGARLTYAINPDGSRNLEPK